MLYECNYLRLLSFKYVPVFFGLSISLGIVPQLITQHNEAGVDVTVDVIVFLLISVLCFLVFFLLKDKYQYVAIGKSKLIVGPKRKEVEYSWLDVEYIRLNRFLGLYKLKLKGEEPFYFTAYGTVTWFLGDNSDMGAIIDRMKRELSL